jgi:hypothetical protein
MICGVAGEEVPMEKLPLAEASVGRRPAESGIQKHRTLTMR